MGSKWLGMLLISRRLLLPWILLLLSGVLPNISAFTGNGCCSGSLLSERSRLGWCFGLGEKRTSTNMVHRHHPLYCILNTFSDAQLLVSSNFKSNKPACGPHRAHSAGWETAYQDQSGLQVALAALLQVQVDPLQALPGPVALERSPAPAVVEPDP